jgi:hypothetical protein
MKTVVIKANIISAIWRTEASGGLDTKPFELFHQLLLACMILVGALFLSLFPAAPAAASTLVATCNGAADSATAFQSALDVADPAHGGDGVVIVPPGPQPCLIGRPLLLHSGETIEAGPGAAMLEPLTPASSHNPLLLLIKGVSHVTIRGLKLDGRAKQVGTSASLVIVYSSDHVLFSHVSMRNARGTAVTFSGGPRGITDSGIEDSVFSNIGTYYLVSDNKQADRNQSVVWCCGAKTTSSNDVNQHNFVQTSTFSENGFDNLSITQQSWFIAAGNHFAGSYNGANIYCAHNSHLQITDNVTGGAAGNGIDCYVNDDLSIIGNQSSYNGAAGIQAAETHCGLIMRNTTMDNFRSSLPDWANSHAGTSKSVHQGGITIGGEASDKIGTVDVTISQNISGDNQKMPTQQFGIEVRPPATILSLSILPDNTLIGNIGGSFGGQLKTVQPPAAAACQLWTGHS